MFPSSLEHPYAPRGRRRGRNDPNSRDYICPCGKSYLSYPALFTHIKIKHNGRAPGQIIKPKSQNPSKRGRPRQKQVYDSESDTNDIAANCIDRLCDFVTEFQKPEQKLCSKLKDLYTKDSFYRVYLNYNTQEQQPRYNQREDLYDEYCDNVFCEVIAEVNKRLNEPYHIDSVIVFFMLLGNFINESTSGENIEQQRNQAQYGYGQYNQNQEENLQNDDYMEENQNNFNQEDDEIVEEEYPEEQNQSEKKEDFNQQALQRDINNEEQNQPNNQAEKVNEYIQNQEAQGNEDPLFKLKQQPIRNIVNYINNFIINYTSKYYQTNQLQEYPFFLESNIKIFVELLFNWLTMKKYVGYKLKVNKNYN